MPDIRMPPTKSDSMVTSSGQHSS